MRTTQLFGSTLRETSSEMEMASHQLLVRGGFIRQLGSGLFTKLHLGKKVQEKIEGILKEEMDGIGGQEIEIPIVQPADLWKESGRWFQIGSEMGRFKDRHGHDLVLAMTHEEVVSQLSKFEIQSYKQLPRIIYQIGTKFRDDPRPRGGLIRTREFTMKDSYSLASDEPGLNTHYQLHYEAYQRIFSRCSLPVMIIRSDLGMMGGKTAHEFMYLNGAGEDAILVCGHCDYRSNKQIARMKKDYSSSEEPLEINKVHTPGAHTIEELANFLIIPTNKTAKAVFLMAKFLEQNEIIEKFIFAIVRGDMDLNESKLMNSIGAFDLRPAFEDEILGFGAVPGFASPIGLKDVFVVVDDLIPYSHNLVSGANEKDYHFLNVNYGRDYSAALIADIVSVNAGDPCPDCGQPMSLVNGIEVGNIFNLGTRYSESLHCLYLDAESNLKPIFMGSYGIGVERLMACIVEAHHDQNGIIWPISVAPYTIHLILLRGKGDTASELRAEQVYKLLKESRLEVIFDDGMDSPGVKFNNADLIGCPIRLTISDRASAAGGIELKVRNRDEKIIIKDDELLVKIESIILELNKEISNELP